MSTEDAKTYLSSREIPRLLESLMTGLMYHRPADHIKYLIDCLEKVKEKGYENVTWSFFVDIRRAKTPLPPIGDKNGKRPRSRPSSRTKTPVKIDDRKSIDDRKGSPLPPIPKTPPASQMPIVFFMGGPGSGKLTQIQKVLESYKDWVHLSMGDLLRNKISKKGTVEEKWEMIGDLVSRGEMAPEDITLDLLTSKLKKHKTAKGVIIEGYPRTMAQVEEFEKNVGNVDLVVLIDCDEHYSIQRLLKRGQEKDQVGDQLSAINKRITYYKENTLPAVKYYDDLGKVVLVDGDKDIDEISFEVKEIFSTAIKSKFALPGKPDPDADPNDFRPQRPLKADISIKQDKSVTDVSVSGGVVVPPPTISSKDEGRKEGLPTCPIIFIGGGPGSGRGTQCKLIVERYKDVVHLSMGDILRSEIASKGSVDEKWGMISELVSKGDMAPQEETVVLLMEEMKKHPKAGAFLVEGYPRDAAQVEEFNKKIGGVNFVVILDCEQYYMQMRLLNRGKEKERIDDNPNAVNSRILFYKNNTLPIYKHYDDQGKLVVIDGDKDYNEIFYELCMVLDFALFGRKQGAETDNKTTDNADTTEKTDHQEVSQAAGNQEVVENKTDETQKEEGQEKTEEPQKEDVKEEKVDEPQKEEVKEEKTEEPQKEEVQENKVEETQNQEVQEAKPSEPQKEEEKSEEPPKQEVQEETKQETQNEVVQDEKKEEAQKEEVKEKQKDEAQTKEEEKPQQEVQEEKSEAPKQEVQEEQTQEAKKEEVVEEVVEAIVTQDTANTTGDNVGNPSHSEKLDEAAKEQTSEGTG